MKTVFIVIAILFSMGTYAEPPLGEKLFSKHCLSCHAVGKFADQLDFTIKRRLFPIKNSLIESLRSKQMPPGQYVVEQDCPPIRSSIPLLSDQDRQRLIQWIEGISEDDPTSILPNLEERNSDQFFEKEIKRRNLHEVVIDQNDLIYSYGNNSNFDITSFFKLKKKLSDQEISVAGIKVDPLSSSSLHHIIVGYQNPALGSIIPWAKFRSYNLLPEGVEVSVENSPLNVMVHRYFKSTQFKSDTNLLKIRLFIKNTKVKNRYQIVNYPTTLTSPLLANYTGTLQYQYSAPKAYIIKMIAPHMHERGLQLKVERVNSNPLQSNRCLAEFYGFNEQGMGKYPFVSPQRIEKDEKIQISCHYKNTGIPLQVGWGAKEEMCTVFLYLEEIENAKKD